MRELEEVRGEVGEEREIEVGVGVGWEREREVWVDREKGWERERVGWERERRLLEERLQRRVLEERALWVLYYVSGVIAETSSESE